LKVNNRSHPEEDMNDPMQPFADFATELAQESGRFIMKYFGKRITADRKSDSTPVTETDRGAEKMMREMIGQRFPGHRVLGEEFGSSGPEDAEYKWVLDPIDGTKSFMHGVPLFGTLIALLRGDVPILGVINLPALGEMALGCQGRPTTLNGAPVKVSETGSLAEATLLITSPVRVHETSQARGFEKLERSVRLTRGWGDCYGHFLVAVGRADIMYDPVLSLWDVAALKPVVEGAGGTLTDKDGNNTGLGNSALSTNGRLHQGALDIISGG